MCHVLTAAVPAVTRRWLHRQVSCHLSSLGFLKGDLCRNGKRGGAGGGWYTLGLCPYCWHASFQFFVSLKWLWPRTNRQHSHSKQWNDNCFEVTENCFTVTFRHHIVPFPDSSLVWKNGMPHNTSVVMKMQSSVYCLGKPSAPLPVQKKCFSFGEA